MGLNLRGPADETPFQAVERLTALKLSLNYDGGGFYSGGPNNAGCDADDMNDLNNELACSAMEAAGDIRRLIESVQTLIHSDGSTSKTGYASPFFAGIRKLADAITPAREAVTA